MLACPQAHDPKSLWLIHTSALPLETEEQGVRQSGPVLKHTHDLTSTCAPMQTKQEALYAEKAGVDEIWRRPGWWYRRSEETASTWQEAAWGLEDPAGRVCLPVRDARTADILNFSVQSGDVLSAVPAQHSSSDLLEQACLSTTVVCLRVLAQVLAWCAIPVVQIAQPLTAAPHSAWAAGG